MRYILVICVILFALTSCAEGPVSSKEYEPSQTSVTRSCTNPLDVLTCHDYTNTTPERWFLVVGGQRISVPKSTYDACDVGENYPVCGD